MNLDIFFLISILDSHVECMNDYDIVKWSRQIACYISVNSSGALSAECIVLHQMQTEQSDIQYKGVGANGWLLRVWTQWAKGMEFDSHYWSCVKESGTLFIMSSWWNWKLWLSGSDCMHVLKSCLTCPLQFSHRRWDCSTFKNSIPEKVMGSEYRYYTLNWVHLRLLHITTKHLESTDLCQSRLINSHMVLFCISSWLIIRITAKIWSNWFLVISDLLWNFHQNPLTLKLLVWLGGSLTVTVA